MSDYLSEIRLKAMNITNLTPHTLNIILSDGTTRAIPPSGSVARCRTVNEPAGYADGVPLVRVAYGAVEGLPEAAEGVLYVVSALVRAAVPERSDVASPGDLVRDPEGNVVGCRGLVVN